MTQVTIGSSVDLIGLDFRAIDEDHCVDEVMNALDVGRGGWIITANLDHLRRYRHDDEYRDLCRQASLVVADGRPVIWAARLQGTPLPGQVAGSNLIWSLSRAAAARGRSVFLLGGLPGAAEKAAERLRDAFPGLRIAGTHCPDFGFEARPAAVFEIAAMLHRTAPDIIFVALGSPKQERLIARIRHVLPRSWWIGVGISFSFVAGDIRRAPAWMQRCGMEWLHRLLQEPRRLAKRYLVQGVPFAAYLFAHAGVRRFTTHPRPTMTETSEERERRTAA